MDSTFQSSYHWLMAAKAKKAKSKTPARKEAAEDRLWIAPRYSLKGPAGERAWENRPGGAPSSSRYLELADVALGTKKPETSKKRKSPIAGEHITNKTEPYSN
jgi:hypothetical protein